MSQEHVATLRIWSKSKGVPEISEALAIEPSRSNQIGDLLSPRNPLSQKCDHAIWLYESALPRGAEIGDHVDAVLTLVESRVENFLSLSAECEGDISCGVFNETGKAGFNLSSGLLKRVSDLGLDLTFDLYLGE